jgi:hypothetical protein
MKVLIITGCKDSMRWYSGLVGKAVPYLGEDDLEFRSREPEGYINFVQLTDATVIDVSNSCPTCEE